MLVVQFQHTATRRWLPQTALPLIWAHEFQHTATRRWLRGGVDCEKTQQRFNTQPPEGGCSQLKQQFIDTYLFQHTATRRWLRNLTAEAINRKAVSTHSHPKVAALFGWLIRANCPFQHTATRRWLLAYSTAHRVGFMFQHTATRRWLLRRAKMSSVLVGFNTQPPEGGCHQRAGFDPKLGVSTHSHPKVAADVAGTEHTVRVFQHTATRRWLRPSSRHTPFWLLFQHTATRRWLLS